VTAGLAFFRAETSVSLCERVNVSWTFVLWYDTGNFWKPEQLLASQAGLIHGVCQSVLQYFKESIAIKKILKF